MIESTVGFLNTLSEPEGKKPLQEVYSRPNLPLRAALNTKKEYVVHFACFQTWFLSCSVLQKVETITRMMDGIKSLSSLRLILNTLHSVKSKAYIYSHCQHFSSFVFDRIVTDHNRSLEKSALTAVQCADIEWFNNLEIMEQTSVMIALLRLGGGSIRKIVYEQAIKLYNLQLQELCTHQIRSTLNADTSSRYKSNPNMSIQHFGSFSGTLTSTTNLSLGLTESTLINHDPKDPFTIEVEAKRKKWNDLINAYRIQVEGKPKKPKKEKSSKSKSSKKSGSSKSDKSSKKSKKDKKGKDKKGKKGKKGKNKNEALDMIQLLPVWVVKQIFGYLDKKTLKKVKGVNKYWEYVINDLNKERNARKKLNKVIKKLEASVDPNIEQEIHPKRFLKDTYAITTQERRLKKLSERGATHPKLNKPLKRPYCLTALLTSATAELAEDYLLPVTELTPFPRSCAQCPLYSPPSCMATELGFIAVNTEPISRPKLPSFSSGENELEDKVSVFDEFSLIRCPSAKSTTTLSFDPDRLDSLVSIEDQEIQIGANIIYTR